MKVRQIKRNTEVVLTDTITEEKPKKTGGRKKNDLPPDTYKDEIEPLEIETGDKQKLVFSVKRKGDLGLPYVDIRTWVDTETYSGPTKKGVNFPLSQLLEFLDNCHTLHEVCEEKGLLIEEEE
jgi:hypothetical protein